jgi:enoyl-CoA hydratase/carnithine racemase
MPMNLKSAKVLARVEDSVGWLTLNNPERRNAVSVAMWHDIGEVLQAFEADPAVRVAVLHGAGGKSFMAGADISEFAAQRHDAASAASYREAIKDARNRLDTFAKPLIAMIQGYCIGGGMAAALAADLRIASDDSKFAIPAARLGLAYDVESLSGLVAVVGLPFAKEIMMTARWLTADEALRIGLVNRSVPAQDLEEATRSWARSIVENAPLSVRASMVALDEIAARPGRPDLARIDAAMRICFDSADYAEGRAAFMEKRTPRFTGT